MSEYAAIVIREEVRASLQIPRPLQDIVIGYVVSAAELLLYMPNVWPVADYEDEFPYRWGEEMMVYLYIDVSNTDRQSITFSINSFDIERPLDDVYGALADIFCWIKKHSCDSREYIDGINAHVSFLLNTCIKRLLM